jgi:hypothetical protein
MADCFATKEFWRLEPSPKSLASQSSFDSPSNQIAAAKTETRDIAVFYSPQDRVVALASETVSPKGKTIWLNPRTGEIRAAKSQANAGTLKFETPTAGDWLLIVSADLKEMISQVTSRLKKNRSEIDKRKED